MGGQPDLKCENWVDSSVHAAVLSDEKVKAGQVLEIVTQTAAGQVDGTALMILTVAHPVDPVGRFVEARFGGASSPAQTGPLSLAFPAHGPIGGSYGVIHFCTSAPQHCPAIAAGRHVVHLTQFRMRALKQVQEPWEGSQT